MKTCLAVYLFFLFISVHAQTNLYREQYRPQFHFSPASNWTNDPNGLVYNNGIYHLFYQHNPFANKWGHMTWGHAISKDLLHWQHLPNAIKEENGIMIFSGTCVVDKNNTSGFGKEGKIPMVAIYTGHADTNQAQYLAYSLDDGQNWTKYANNPVLDLHKKDFRDPKVFWDEAKKHWVMIVVLSTDHTVQFYESKNLINWDWLSDFGPAGDTGSVWECPDLFEAPVDNNPGKKKWILSMSVIPGMQYFVGEFDGKNFHSESPADKIYRPDYGSDYYAAIAYNQLPVTEMPVMIGWVNNWDYANDIPTKPWKSAMSLPRNISVRKMNDEWVLMQKPLKQVEELRNQPFQLQNTSVSDKVHIGIKSQQLEMEAELQPSANSICGIRLAVSVGHYLEIGYDAQKQKLYMDRSRCANQNFNSDFQKLSYFETPLAEKNDRIRLHIFFDNSIVEVFANDGEAVMTMQIFPDTADNNIELFSKNGICVFNTVKIWNIHSVWKDKN